MNFFLGWVVLCMQLTAPLFLILSLIPLAIYVYKRFILKDSEAGRKCLSLFGALLVLWISAIALVLYLRMYTGFRILS